METSVPVLVHLDSNVIIDMCDGRRDSLKSAIVRCVSTGKYLFPFSASQVSEITQHPITKRCENRLAFLSEISKNVYFANCTQTYEYRVESPFEVYETLNEALPQLNENALFANFISHEQIVECRSQLGLDPAVLNNLSGKEAVKKIDEAINSSIPSEIEAPRSIKEILEVTKGITRENFSPLWERLGSTEEQMTRGEDLQGIFSMLETFGYWPDSKGVYAKGSRFPDSQHLFDAQHCSKLVTSDKGMKNRAEATYAVLGISTQVMFTKEFEHEIVES